MKKVYSLFVALGLLSVSVNAQNVIDHKYDEGQAVIDKSVKVNSMKMPTDTIGGQTWTKFYRIYGCLGYWGGNLVLGQNNCTSNFVGFTKWAQEYLMQYPQYANAAASYKIEEVILLTHTLVEGGSPNTGNVEVSIHDISDSSAYSFGQPPNQTSYRISCPGASPLQVQGSPATATIPWANLDTATRFSIASFANPVFVSNNYAVVADFAQVMAAGDTVGILCSEAGDKISDDYQYISYPGSSGPFWIQLSHFATSGWGRMLGYWPIVDAATSIDKLPYMNGIKFTLAPNPANTNVRVQYSVSDNAKVNIEMYDLTGKLLYEVTEQNVASNITNTSEINVSDYPNGTYYISITANGNRMTQKLVIAK